MKSGSSDECLTVLRQAGVELRPGLSDQEFREIEAELSFKFNVDHRDLLAAALPSGGPEWIDWRSRRRGKLKALIEMPRDGILYEVTNYSLWPAIWGERPSSKADIKRTATAMLAESGQMIPLVGTRYVPEISARNQVASPVFSIYGSDVIVFASSILEALEVDFGQGLERRGAPSASKVVVPFWSYMASATFDLGSDVSPFDDL